MLLQTYLYACSNPFTGDVSLVLVLAGAETHSHEETSWRALQVISRTVGQLALRVTVMAQVNPRYVFPVAFQS